MQLRAVPPGRSDAGSRTTRSAALDVVRIVAVVAVVAGHAYSRHPSTARLIFSWHVPIFFVLSGYLWTPGRSLGSEVRRRGETLLVPYTAWLVIVTTGWLLVRHHRGIHLHERFFHKLLKGGTYIGMPYSAFWFISALFVAAVVFRLIERATGGLAPVVAAAAGVVGVVVAGHSPQTLRSIWWAVGLALPCLLFVAAGALLRKVRPGISWPLLTGAALLLFGGSALRLGVHSLNIKNANFGDPAVTLIVSIALCVGMILVAEGMFVGGLSRSDAISRLAAGALPVVLAHGMFLVVLADEPFDAPLWVFVAALVVPWLAALLIARSPKLAKVLL
jgi:acyltransferase